MAQTTRARMDQHGDMAGMEAQCAGEPRVINMVNPADFEKMIAGAKRAELLGAALVRSFADALRVRAGEPSAFFGVFKVLLRRVTIVQCPFRTFVRHQLDLLAG